MKNINKTELNENKEKSNMISNYNWQIHAIKNGCLCENDGEYIFDMIPGAANFHTHGMEQYNHPDFQLVLDYDLDTAAYILNTLGERVSSGERFNPGDYVKGIFEDCEIRLETFEETGRDVLRVIVPDANNVFPDEEGCRSSYLHQMWPTEELYINHDIEKNTRTATVLELNGGFNVEIVRNGDVTECYLEHKDCGIKDFMFGVPEQGAIVEDILIEKISEYIELYKDKYFNRDVTENTEAYQVLNRYQVNINSYDLEDGFMVDAYYCDDGMLLYLYHKDYGIKTLMLVWDKNTEMNYEVFENIGAYMAAYSEAFLDEPEIR